MRQYRINLDEVYPAGDALLMAIAERLERIAELMEQRQQQDDREAEEPVRWGS